MVPPGKARPHCVGRPEEVGAFFGHSRLEDFTHLGLERTAIAFRARLQLLDQGLGSLRTRICAMNPPTDIRPC